MERGMGGLVVDDDDAITARNADDKACSITVEEPCIEGKGDCDDGEEDDE